MTALKNQKTPYTNKTYFIRRPSIHALHTWGVICCSMSVNNQRWCVSRREKFRFCRCQDHLLDGDIRAYGICMSKDMMYQYMIYGRALYGDMGDDNDWMIDVYPISLVVSKLFDFHTDP